MILFLPDVPDRAEQFEPDSLAAFTCVLLDCCTALPLVPDDDGEEGDARLSVNPPLFLDALMRAGRLELWPQLATYWAATTAWFAPKDEPLVFDFQSWQEETTMHSTSGHAATLVLGMGFGPNDPGPAAELLAGLPLDEQFDLMVKLAQLACAALLNVQMSCLGFGLINQIVRHLLHGRPEQIVQLCAIVVTAPGHDFRWDFRDVDGPREMAVSLAVLAKAALMDMAAPVTWITTGDDPDAPPDGVLKADEVDPTPGEDNPHWALGMAWQMVMLAHAVEEPEDIGRLYGRMETLSAIPDVLAVIRALASWIRDELTPLEEYARRAGMEAPEPSHAH